MRKIIMAATIAALVAVSRGQALAVYCGPAADTKAVEKLVRHLPYGHDRTAIMDVAVAGNYARADIEGAGQLIAYFVKSKGVWKPIAMGSAQQTVPAATMTKLNTMGYPKCVNPRFVNHPSGP